MALDAIFQNLVPVIGWTFFCACSKFPLHCHFPELSLWIPHCFVHWTRLIPVPLAGLLVTSVWPFSVLAHHELIPHSEHSDRLFVSEKYWSLLEQSVLHAIQHFSSSLRLYRLPPLVTLLFLSSVREFSTHFPFSLQKHLWQKYTCVHDASQ